jgi:hypothetical protein
MKQGTSATKRLPPPTNAAVCAGDDCDLPFKPAQESSLLNNAAHLGLAFISSSIHLLVSS